MNKIRPILLGAGRGSRMGKLTENGPKYSLVFNNMSLLDRLLRQCEDQSYLKPILVAGYLPEFSKSKNIRLIINENWQTTNMVFSLKLALDEIEPDIEDILVLYTDIFFNSSLLKKVQTHFNQITMPINTDWEKLWKLRMDNYLDDIESLKIDSDGFIKNIGEKFPDITNVDGQYMGILTIPRSHLTTFKNYINLFIYEFGESLSLTEFLNWFVSKNNKVLSLSTKGGWLEFDTESDYEIYNKILNNEVDIRFEELGLEI